MRDEDKIQTASSNQTEAERYSHKKEWIVKTNSRILGPYSFDEVVQNIKDHRFVPHDEIIAPKGRWKLIKQEDVFNEAVNEFRNKQSSSQNNPGSITVTENATAPIDLVEDSFRNAKRLMEGVDEQVQKPVYNNAESRDATKIYSYQNDQKVKKKFSQLERFKIIAALVVFVVAGVFTYFKSFNPTSGKSKQLDIFQEAVLNAEKSEKSGDYSKALSFYSEARNLKPNDLYVILKSAALILVNEKQTLQASRMFKQILEVDTDSDRKKAALIGLGLVSLESHELDVAKDYFSKVLSQDAQSTAAQFNLGVVLYLKDQFDEAETLIAKSLDRGGSDGAVVLALSDLTSVMPGKTDKAVSMLKAYLDVRQDYRPQVAIQLAKILASANKTSEATKYFNSVLEMDPEYVETFERNWQIYRGSATWDRALDNLKKAWVGINVTPQALAVQGLIMYWGREKLEGAQLIDQALSQSPKDPQLLAVSGWVNYKLGRRELAVTNIKEAATMTNEFKVPKILAARLCLEDKDFECAQRNFEQVLKLDQKNLSAYLGLAQVFIQRKDYNEALRWLRQGQAMDALFTPFFALNDEIQNQMETANK